MTQPLALRDRIIPWYFVMFFAAIALVDGVMVTIAVRTNTGLVVDHPYERGLAYNDVLAAADAQTKLGWKAEIAWKDGVLSVSLHDADGQPIAPDRITAHFASPTTAKLDFEVTLENGTATVALPQQGVWDVRVDAAVGNQHYQQTQRIVAE